MKKQAILRLIFGQLQIIGATMTFYFLLTTGESKHTYIACAITGAITVTSLLLFRVIWKQPKS